MSSLVCKINQKRSAAFPGETEKTVWKKVVTVLPKQPVLGQVQDKGGPDALIEKCIETLTR